MKKTHISHTWVKVTPAAKNMEKKINKHDLFPKKEKKKYIVAYQPSAWGSKVQDF